MAQRVLSDERPEIILMVTLFPWLHGHHGNHKCLKNTQKCHKLLPLNVTIGTTNLNITLLFMVHVGWDIFASEMKTKSENIL